MNFSNLKEWETPRGNVVQLAIDGKIAWKKVMGTPIGDIPVGSTIYLHYNNAVRKFLIVHQGLPNSTYDESCNGTWLLLDDNHPNGTFAWDYYDSENDIPCENSYSESSIHNLIGWSDHLFVEKIRNIVKTVKIPYRPGSGESTNVLSGANGLSTKCFLLSYIEVGFSADNYLPVEGAVLDYFKDGTKKKRIFKIGGYARDWWLRTPHTGGYDCALLVGTYGDSVYNTCDSSYYPRFAFILPSETLVDENFNVIA